MYKTSVYSIAIQTKDNSLMNVFNGYFYWIVITLKSIALNKGISESSQRKHCLDFL